ncbi:hypothetical protein EJP82_11265 [Paenibacillus anaericanus]|uniref:Uncharacterized protein n=1 Tax=Paenibacillus anaericanus TaxID=170367 RepID=A0A433Y958_9BACL|nr:hypothetical protein [Paenibacillus anaericanus]RUT46425.1 hypothetical protein EJP82_11265 [Paenibacillus anaericanus]
MRIAAYSDFYGEAMRPLQLIIQVHPGELDWSRTLYIPLSSPFDPFEAEEFGDVTGVSVLLEDMVRQPGSTPVIGIHLPSIAKRHGTEIHLLILQMDDVEEVLKYERGYFSE